MAALTVTQAVRNTATEVTINNGAASFEIDWNFKDEDLVLFITQGDAAVDADLNIATNGFGGADASDFSYELTHGKSYVLTGLESMYLKKPSDGKLYCTLTDTDGTPYSGTVTAIKVSVLRLPKGL